MCRRIFCLLSVLMIGLNSFFNFSFAEEGCCIEKEKSSFSTFFSDLKIGWRDYCSYPYRLYIAHSEGDGIGYAGGYSTIGVFSAPSLKFKCNFRPFFDGKALIFNNGRLGTNVGLGGRWILPNQSMVMGLNVYYDYLKAYHLSFQQIGVGYELLTPCFDFRVNGYIPVGNQCQVNHVDAFHYPGGYVFKQGDQYTPFTGVDAEVGTWIGSCGCNEFGFYLAAGPYYYKQKHCCRDFCGRDNAVGGRGRFIATYCDWLSVNASVSYDSYWHGRGQVQLVLCLPFDRCFWNRKGIDKSNDSLLGQIARQPTYRQEVIPVARQDVFKWNWDASPCSSCCPR